MTGMQKLKKMYSATRPKVAKTMKEDVRCATACSAAAFILGVKAVKHYGRAKAAESSIGDFDYAVKNFKDDEE